MDTVKKVSKKQREVITALFLEENTLEEILVDKGVAVDKFLKWINEPAFKNFLDAQADARIIAATFSAWSALIRGVERGEAAAIKLFFEMKAKEEMRGKQEKDVEKSFEIQMNLPAREAAA